MIWCSHFVRCHLGVGYSPVPSPLQSTQVLCPGSSNFTFTPPPPSLSHTLLVSCKSLRSVSLWPEQPAMLLHNLKLKLSPHVGDSGIHCQRFPRLLYPEAQAVAIRTVGPADV